MQSFNLVPYAELYVCRRGNNFGWGLSWEGV
jgi:hypothetical protein